MSGEIQCSSHENGQPVIVCKHLLSGSSLGYAYISAEIEHDEEDFDTAMCVRCEAIPLKDRSWSDRLYDAAGFSYVCSGCLVPVLKRHKKIAQGKVKCT